MTPSCPGYFDRRASRYLARSERVPWKSLRAVEWRALETRLVLSEGLDVLDLGCGAGYYSLRLRGVRGVRVYGVDASEGMMRAYRALGFDGACCPVETFTSPRKFDRVLIAGLLEFVEHPERVFQRLPDLLNDSGRIVCLIPNRGLVGWIYGAVHELGSCPTFVRDAEDYFRLAAKHGFQATDHARAAFLSSAFVLRPAGSLPR